MLGAYAGDLPKEPVSQLPSVWRLMALGFIFTRLYIVGLTVDSVLAGPSPRCVCVCVCMCACVALSACLGFLWKALHPLSVVVEDLWLPKG